MQINGGIMSILGNFSVIKEFNSGQKNVSLVDSEIFGLVIVKKGSCTDKNSLRRICQEVELLRKIDSEYFPKNIEFRYSKQGSFLIIEEYIESQALIDCIGFFNTECKIMHLIDELIQGLSLLWENRIVHRDLKPHNILIKSDMKPVIIDLGIARVLTEESITSTSQKIGPATKVFAAPEQLKNDKESISARTDFYQLGILMLLLLFGGKHPFDPRFVGSGYSIFENIMENNFVTRIDGITPSEHFLKITHRLLGYNPYERYRTPKEFHDDIMNGIILGGC